MLSLEEALQQEGKVQCYYINNSAPMLSWALATGKQTAFQVLVASKKELLSEDKADCWNSGRINSSENVSNIYRGKALHPLHAYYWKVKIWNGSNASLYSTVQGFITGETLTDFALPSFVLQKHQQHPVSQCMLANQHVIYDFGKDGFGQLTVTINARGNTDTLMVHLGEQLLADGSINRKPPGTVRYRLFKLPLVSGSHTYQIKIQADRRNTGSKAILMPAYIGEVMPFRYVEIGGLSKNIKIENITRYLVTDDFDDAASNFNCSDTALNNMWDFCKYTAKATTFSGFYVDGDRERIPYEADALINQWTHYATDAEFNMAKRSLNYLIAHPTWPTEWSLQNVLIAWNDYLYSGDGRLIKQLYTDLQHKMLIALAREDGLISSRTGKQSPEFLKSIHYKAFGDNKKLTDIVDWPHTGMLGLNEGEGGETDGFVFTDYNSVVNAYYYENLKIMSRLSAALGFKADAERYIAEATKVKASFLKAFISAATGLVLDGEDVTHSSLHANAFALAFGLVPADKVPGVVKFIHSRGMACSVYGSQFLLDGLAAAGDAEYGMSLITSHNKRSWFNMINEGATMTMEAWGQAYKPNQDWNHVWGTAPGNYIVRHLMGIQPIAAGCKTMVIKPQPGKLEQASIDYLTIRGKLHVNFKNNVKAFDLNVALPGNMTANVYLPYYSANDQVIEGGRKGNATREGNYWKLINVQPGMHRYSVKKQ